jgi:hypothetical protein
MSKVKLSEPTEFEIRNTVLKVYPISLEKIIEINPKVEALSKTPDIEKQANLIVELVYEIIKADNEISKEELKKVLTVEAGVKILKRAMGGDAI